MKTISSFACAAMVAGLGLLAAPAHAGKWHHLHLSATDTPAAAKWYVDNFGGQAVKFGNLDVAMSGGTTIAFFKVAENVPSEGSSVDHIGFSVDNTDAAIEKFKAAGVKIVAEPKPLPGGMKYAFIEDPWGTKIEILDDPETKGFHHVHLHSPDPDATIKWYADTFGGEVTKFKNIPILPAIKYGNMWLIVQKTAEAKAPTDKRAIDHLGFSFPDLPASMTELKAKNVKVVADVVKTPAITFAFIEGPDGVKIELVQGN